MKSYGVTIWVIPLQLYFHMVLFIILCKRVLPNKKVLSGTFQMFVIHFLDTKAPVKRTR